MKQVFDWFWQMPAWQLVSIIAAIVLVPIVLGSVWFGVQTRRMNHQYQTRRAAMERETKRWLDQNRLEGTDKDERK